MCGGVTDNDSELETGEPSSNSSQTRYIPLDAKTLRKGMNPPFFLPQDMS